MAQGAALNGLSQPVYITDVFGNPMSILFGPTQNNSGSAGADLDTNGDPVPTYKAHSYTYDDSGNLSTDSVTNGTNTWTRTYTYTPSGPASDSGWVKQ